MFAVYAEKSNFESPLTALAVGELPDAICPEGWVRIKVKAGGLNRHDIWTLQGVGAVEPVYPLILGCDCVGVTKGADDVMLYPVVGNPDWRDDETLDVNRSFFSEGKQQGTFAEFVSVPPRNLVRKPENLTMEAAAVLGTTWLTAYRMIFTRSDIRPGQTMLVQGCSGGVATALIQLGYAAGMRVWATGRNDEKRELATQLGAERTFATGEDLPRPVDVVFETVGLPPGSIR
jgi:NADPH:quinone reductase-like Zn-dependent oxidoreductase